MPSVTFWKTKSQSSTKENKKSTNSEFHEPINLASRTGDWCVLEVITLSDHQCIEFSIQERSHPVNVGRGGKVRSSSGNTKRLSKDKLREQAESGRSMWTLHASPRARAYRRLNVLVERPVVCPASKMPYSAAEIYLLKGWSSAARGIEKS